MAKFGFKYEVDVENTENQGGDFELMPEMYANLQCESAELRIEGDEENPTSVEAVLTFEVIEPEEYANRKIWAYWLIQHKDGANNKRYFKFGKPMFDRFCRAVDVAEPEDTEDLMFKPFVAKVGISRGSDKKDATGKVIGKYNDKNEIKTFYYPDEPDKMPAIGVIEGGARPSAPANDNRPAANTNASSTAKPAGSKPWAKKA